LTTAKKVKRQETIRLVKGMEVSLLLFAVDQIICRIDIKDDLLRRFFERLYHFSRLSRFFGIALVLFFEKAYLLR